MTDNLAAVGADEHHERARLEALERFQVVGTDPEPQFDRIAALAADLFGVPMALLTFVDRNRLWLKARHGLDVCEVDRSISFCSHTIRGDEAFVLLDAARTPLFAKSPLVVDEPHVRFYAGAPLVTSEGHRIGALCIADTEPRTAFAEPDRRALERLASFAMDQLELRRSDRQWLAMRGFADATELAMLAVDPSGRIEFANRAASELFGYDRREMVGSPLDLIIPERMRGAHQMGLDRVAVSGHSKLSGRTTEVIARRRDGSSLPIEISVSVWRQDKGLGMGAIIRDISARRERDARLLRLAHHDPLTGLTNRRCFEDLLGEQLRQKASASVMLLDLDGFKEVNDSLGHGMGDALLQALAIRLPAALRDDATVARFGGDEFAVLLAGVADPMEVQAQATRILAALETPFEIGGHLLQVGASVGFAIGPLHGEDAEELIASADFALYQAKDCGGRTVRIFEPQMRVASIARRAMQEELLRAFQNGEFLLHYQPQVSLDDGRVFGAEGLLRWQHPERGLLLPGAFLPALKTSSLPQPVGRWVIDEACRQLTEWRAAGLDIGRVSVNLFSGHFRSGTLAGHVLEALETHDIEPSMLELEVTEMIALHHDEHSLASLREIRDLGVRIAFDDFGTGYASLSTLQRFPLTALKIDRSFVRDVVTNPHDAAITRAVVGMGNELGLETIAEGIETAEQEAALRAFGCQSGQGYRYARPMPADAFMRYVLEMPGATEAMRA